MGESNPYGSDPYYALYPAPDGCSGHRLCTLVVQMGRAEYLDTFDRVNLCSGKWSTREARAASVEIESAGRRCILLGSKVCSAFNLVFRPFTTIDSDILILPHPSGLCRLWNEEGAFDRAAGMVREFIKL